jgi:hypothetical protein
LIIILGGGGGGGGVGAVVAFGGSVRYHRNFRNFDDRAGLDSVWTSKQNPRKKGAKYLYSVNKSGAWFGKVGSKDTSGKFRIDAVLCALSRPCA